MSETTVATVLATSAVVFALALAFHTNAMASSAPMVDSSHTIAAQTPAVPIGLQPGCYVGTVSPFTITQVPCMFNSSPLGSLHEPTTTSTSKALNVHEPYGW